MLACLPHSYWLPRFRLDFSKRVELLNAYLQIHWRNQRSNNNWSKSIEGITRMRVGIKCEKTNCKLTVALFFSPLIIISNKIIIAVLFFISKLNLLILIWKLVSQVCQLARCCASFFDTYSLKEYVMDDRTYSVARQGWRRLNRTYRALSAYSSFVFRLSRDWREYHNRFWADRIVKWTENKIKLSMKRYIIWRLQSSTHKLLSTFSLSITAI